jgi:hypothetical protein
MHDAEETSAQMAIPVPSAAAMSTPTTSIK